MRPFVAILVLITPLAGCERHAPDATPSAPAAIVNTAPQAVPTTSVTTSTPATATKPSTAAEPWGTLKGRIVWGDKELPKRTAIEVKKDHNDFRFCTKGGPFVDDIFIGDAKSKGMKNVFVWLAAVDDDGQLTIHPDRKKIPENEKKVVIDQPVCMFVPHALALREGQILVVKNSAAVPHSFKWSGSPEVNVGGNTTILPGQQAELAIKADRLPIAVGCGFHSWMQAWIRAFDHPYFALTDDQGRFEIKDAPIGACRLIVWHEQGWLGGRAGKKGRAITVQSGDNDLGTLEYLPPQ